MSTLNSNKPLYKLFAKNFNTIIGYMDGDRSARSTAAEKLGVTYENVRVWSEGFFLPKADMLLKIKIAYNVSIDWLLTGETPVGEAPPFSPAVMDICLTVRDVMEQNTDAEIKEAMRSMLTLFKHTLEKAAPEPPADPLPLIEPDDDYENQLTTLLEQSHEPQQPHN